MKRLISIALALVMCLGMVSMLFVTSGAEGTAPTLEIKGYNLSFQNSVAIKYAVESSVENVKLLIWTKPMEDYVLGTQAKEIDKYSFSNAEEVKDYYIFDYTDLVAKQMTDVVYARACAEVDGVVYYSELVKYSILEYAYRKLGKIGSKPTTNENLKEMLSAMLEYGAGAQKYLDYSADRLATADWVLVALAAGLIDDGSAHGLYLPGDTVALTAPATRANGTTFDHWEDGAGNVVSTTASFELTVGTTNEVYTPVYYSLGLEYEEGYVVGAGSWSGTTLAIPPADPNGTTVEGIGASAFENNADITTVFLPATIKTIESNAFKQCTSLTDVYYDGTEEEWAAVSVATRGNSTLLSATMHFKDSATETFTVTFVDFDGTVLKTETVESGKSATAPADPTRTGYAFAGWDVAFDNITADLTVTATYTLNVTAPTVVVHDVVANVGDTTVDVVISLENNPGIASMKFAVNYGDELVLQSYTFNSAYEGFATLPEPFKSPQNVSFMHGTSNVADSDFVTLTFALADTVTEDTVLDISLVLDEKNIFDKNFNTVAFEVLAGKVFIR